MTKHGFKHDDWPTLRKKVMAAGIPAHGNQRDKWDAGCRFDHPNPEYR